MNAVRFVPDCVVPSIARLILRDDSTMRLKSEAMGTSPPAAGQRWVVTLWQAAPLPPSGPGLRVSRTEAAGHRKQGDHPLDMHRHHGLLCDQNPGVYLVDREFTDPGAGAENLAA